VEWEMSRQFWTLYWTEVMHGTESVSDNLLKGLTAGAFDSSCLWTIEKLIGCTEDERVSNF